MKSTLEKLVALFLVLSIIALAVAGYALFVEPPPPVVEGDSPVVELPPYEITYYFLVNSISADEEMIEERLNALVQPKINATVDLVMLDWGIYRERTLTSIRAGQKVDIIFTADDFGYVSDWAEGLLLPVTDLMIKYAPQTKANMGDIFFYGTQINGVNYAIKNKKEVAGNAGIVWNTDLAGKYLLCAVMLDTDDITDLEPILRLIKKNEPDIIPYLAWGLGAVPATQVGVSWFVVDTRDLNDTNIEFIYEFEPVIHNLRTRHRYNQLGFIDDEAQKNIRAHMVAGDFFAVTQPLKLFDAKSEELQAAGGQKFLLSEQSWTPRVATTDHIGGSMLAIPRTSGNPERTMMFIELLNTVPEISNLLVWGIEGVHHTVASPVPGDPPDLKRVAPIEGNTWTVAILPWTIGSVFNHWLSEREDARKHEGYLITADPEFAPHHISRGFRWLEVADYHAELTAIDDAVAPYAGPLSTGNVEDFDYTHGRLMRAAEAAGLRTVQAAVQEAFNEWLVKTGRK